MLITVIIREGAVRMHSGSQIDVNESTNVYVPYWRDIKTFTSWLLKEIIVEVRKIHADSKVKQSHYRLGQALRFPGG
jgi:hypothetical protein